MPNYLMRCISCKVVILCLILMIVNSSSQDSQGTKKLSVAKRSFLSRERDYLKSRPISDDLKSFIKRFKRKTWGYLGKIKRQDEIKNHMFVVNNGNIEPLENMNDVTANMPSSDPSGLGNFTVIPLVIPITVKTFTNATFCDNTTETSEELYPSTESIRKSEKITDDDVTEPPEKPTGKPTKSSNHSHQSSSSGADTTTVNTTESTTEIIIDNAISTMKSDSMKFLNKVLTDVQDLISYEKEGKSSGSNEGAMCTVVGDWDSNAGGMEIQITPRNESGSTPRVEVVEQEPEAEEGFLRASKWNVTMQMPFNHSSLVVLTAVSEKIVASFIGECRICEGAETIAGNWMLARRSTSCKDRQETHSFFSDVMRKSNIRRLQKAHLDELSTRNLVSTTTQI